MRLQASPIFGGTADQFVPAFCFSTDAVGDAVYIMGNKIGERYQITKTDIDDISTVPAIGIIIKKPSATDCVVQTGGIIRDIYTGLAVQKTLFIGTDSRLTTIVTPHKPTAGRRAHQAMGQVLATSDLLLSVKLPIILVT